MEAVGGDLFRGVGRRRLHEDAAGERAGDERAQEVAEVCFEVLEGIRGVEVWVLGRIAAVALHEVEDGDDVFGEVLADVGGPRATLDDIFFSI